MTDEIRLSPRFVFLGGGIATRQEGFDSFTDVVIDLPDRGEVTAFDLHGRVRITLPGLEGSFETNMAGPESGFDPVEIGRAVLGAVMEADPLQADPALARLRRQIVEFFSDPADELD